MNPKIPFLLDGYINQGGEISPYDKVPFTVHTRPLIDRYLKITRAYLKKNPFKPLKKKTLDIFSEAPRTDTICLNKKFYI